jgi:drug/metabolite transporter (DMT)-like permease
MKVNKGIFYMIGSGLCFMIVNFFVKILGSGESNGLLPVYSKFPTHELVLFRSIISFSISAYLLRKRNISILGTNRKGLFVRGFSGMIALTLFFYTIHHLPIAIASTLQYLAPIFTIVLAALFVKEKISPFQWICILIALLGVGMIGFSKSDLQIQTVPISWKWVSIGIISAIFSGIAYISVVRLKATETPLNIVIYFPMLSLPVMGIWSLFDFVIPQYEEWIYLILLGIFTQIAQVLMTKAFLTGDVGIITPFQYLGSIYALFVGYYLFNESLAPLAIIGIFFILIGVLVNVFVKRKVKST